MAEKYGFHQIMFQHDLDSLEDQLESLQGLDLNLMYNQHYFPQNLTDFQLPHSNCLNDWA